MKALTRRVGKLWPSCSLPPSYRMQTGPNQVVEEPSMVLALVLHSGVVPSGAALNHIRKNTEPFPKYLVLYIISIVSRI